MCIWWLLCISWTSSSCCRILEGIKIKRKLVRNGLFPANIYLFKFNNANFRKMCEISSKLTVKTPKRRQWRCSGVLMLTLNIFHNFFIVSNVDFDQGNVSWKIGYWSNELKNIRQGKSGLNITPILFFRSYWW